MLEVTLKVNGYQLKVNRTENNIVNDHPNQQSIN